MGGYGGVVFYGSIIKNGEDWDDCDLTDEQEEFYNNLSDLKEGGIRYYSPYNGTFDKNYHFIIVEKSMHDSEEEEIFIIPNMDKYNETIKRIAEKHGLIIDKPNWMFVRDEIC